jgi:hypothetical protein
MFVVTSCFGVSTGILGTLSASAEANFTQAIVHAAVKGRL